MCVCARTAVKCTEEPKFGRLSDSGFDKANKACRDYAARAVKYADRRKLEDSSESHAAVAMEALNRAYRYLQYAKLLKHLSPHGRPYNLLLFALSRIKRGARRLRRRLAKLADTPVRAGSYNALVLSRHTAALDAALRAAGPLAVVCAAVVVRE